MRPQDVEISAPVMASEAPESTKLFYIRIDRSANTRFEDEMEKHYRDQILYENLRLPDSNVQLQKEPRCFPNLAMWRDVVRRQLKFEQLMVDFLTIAVEGFFHTGTEEDNIQLLG